MYTEYEARSRSCSMIEKKNILRSRHSRSGKKNNNFQPKLFEEACRVFSFQFWPNYLGLPSSKGMERERGGWREKGEEVMKRREME